MLPAEEFTMLEGADHPGRWAGFSFVAKVVATSASDRVYFPFLRLVAGAAGSTINWGDGASYTLTSDYSATISGNQMTNVLNHQYAPGEYMLTIDSNMALLSWWTVYSGALKVFGPGMGCVDEVLACHIPLAFQATVLGSDFGDFQGVAPNALTMFNRSKTGALIACNMKKLVHYGYYAMATNWAAPYGDVENPMDAYPNNYGFYGDVEELWLPNLVFDRVPLRSFCFCHSLKVLYIPHMTEIPARLVSAVPERIDVYVGRLTSIDSKAFIGGGYSVWVNPSTGTETMGNHVFPSGSSTIPETGATVHLHVPMTMAEFKAVSPISWPWWDWSDDSSYTGIRAYGAKYLKVYATDRIFDSVGRIWELDGEHRVDDSGVRIVFGDFGWRWVDHDGNYVMEDGVTPAVYDSEGYGPYPCDSQGRRIDSQGRFRDFGNPGWDSEGRLLSDCGRFINEDGDFIEVEPAWEDATATRPSAIVDFYGQVLQTRTTFPEGWYEAHPEYSAYASLSEYDGYFEKTMRVAGEDRTVWTVYDMNGLVAFRHVVNPPDGRLVSARVTDSGSYLMLGVVPTDTMQVRAVGTLVYHYGQTVEYLAEHYYDYVIVGSLSISGPERAFRLAPGTVYDAGLNHYVGVWMAQAAESYVTLRMPEDGAAFDLTFGNLSLSDGESTETGTAVEEPSEGWAQLGIGGPSYSPEFDLSLVEISDIVSGDRVVTHRFVPYVKDGVTGFKDLISGTFIAPASGAFRPGEYYTT